MTASSGSTAVSAESRRIPTAPFGPTVPDAGTSQEPTRAALDPLGVSTRLDQLPHRARAGPTRRDVDHVVAVDNADASALADRTDRVSCALPSGFDVAPHRIEGEPPGGRDEQ